MTDFRSGNAALGGFNYHQAAAYSALGAFALWLICLFHPLITPACRFTGVALIKEAWIYRGNMRGYIPWRSAWLINCGYARLIFFGGYCAGTVYCLFAGLTKKAPLLLVVWMVVQALCVIFFYLLGDWTFSSFGGEAAQLLLAGPLTAVVMGLAGLVTPLGAGSTLSWLKVSSGASTRPNERILRGSVVQASRTLKPRRALRKAAVNNMTTLAGVLVKRDIETTHFAVMGITNAGKTSALMYLMQSSVNRGDRHLVIDTGGEFMSKFHQEGDVILNPFDQRSVAWDVLSEIEYEQDFDLIASALFPDSGHVEHDKWSDFGKVVFQVALKRWHANKLGTSAEFFTMMCSGILEPLERLCQNSAAAFYFKNSGEGMLIGGLGNIGKQLQAFKYGHNKGGPSFSIKKWIHEGRGNLWLPMGSLETDALKHLVPCWTTLAIRNINALPEDRDRRVWFFLDEFDTIGKIEGLVKATTKSRKYGGCVVLGFQSSAMLREVYGDHAARTIIENCGTKLILRCEMSEGGGTAKFASDIIGECEVERKEVTHSQSMGGRLSQSTSNQSRNYVRKTVLPSEISLLQPFHGYLRLGDEQSWRRIKFDRLDVPIHFGASAPITYEPEPTGISREEMLEMLKAASKSTAMRSRRLAEEASGDPAPQPQKSEPEAQSSPSTEPQRPTTVEAAKSQSNSEEGEAASTTSDGKAQVPSPDQTSNSTPAGAAKPPRRSKPSHSPKKRKAPKEPDPLNPEGAADTVPSGDASKPNRKRLSVVSAPKASRPAHKGTGKAPKVDPSPDGP